MDDYTVYQVLKGLSSKTFLNDEEKSAVKRAMEYIADPLDARIKDIVSECADEYDVPEGLEEGVIYDVCLENISSGSEDNELYDRIKKQVDDIASEFIRNWKDAKDEAADMEREYQRSRI